MPKVALGLLVLFVASAALGAPIPTSMFLQSSVNPSTYGQPVTFSLDLEYSGPFTAGGTVTLYDGVDVITSVPLTSNSVGPFTISTLAPGIPHPVVAVFTGNSGLAGSTSNTVNQVVTAPAPALDHRALIALAAALAIIGAIVIRRM